ncbi:MAG: hypothetical protein WCT32_05695 [Patescibacteria group bacterium]|jgi:ABC-type glycerol-3-phosphate transport system substrate-binding protein
MSSIKKIGRIAKFSTFAVIFSIALSGCTLPWSKKAATTADPDASTIVVWSFEDEDAWKPIAKTFASTYKGYTLKYEKQILDDGYEGRVLNSILSTTKPDLWAMPSDWVYRHKDKLASAGEDKLGEAVGKQGFTMNSTFAKSVKQSVMFNDRIYALAPSAEPLMIYYNQGMLDSNLAKIAQDSKIDQKTRQRAQELSRNFPTSWTGLSELANLLTEKNGNNIDISGLAIGTSSLRSSQDILYLLMMQNETKILSDDLKLSTFNLPTQTSSGKDDYPGKRALEFYTSFSNPGSSNYTWNDSLGDEVDAFVNGKVAMIFGYSDFQNYILQKYPSSKISYKKAPAPQLSEQTDKLTDYAKFMAFGVNRFSKATVMTWRLNYLVATASSSSLNSVNRLYSSQKSTDTDVSLKARTPGNPERISLVTANSLVKGRFPAEFDAIIKNSIDSVNSGRQDSKAAIDLAANDINNLLRKETW